MTDKPDWRYRAEEVAQKLQDLMEMAPGKQKAQLVRDLQAMPRVRIKITDGGAHAMDKVAVYEGVLAAGTEIERLGKFDLREMTPQEFEGVIQSAIHAALKEQQRLDDIRF